MGTESETDNIWVYDIVRKTRTRLTFGTNDWDPVWTPDGERIVFWDGATRALSIKAADGTGELERLVTQELTDSGVPVDLARREVDGLLGQAHERRRMTSGTCRSMATEHPCRC